MKRILAICLCSLIALSAFSQVSKNINLTTAGTLSTLLTANEKTTITNLTITGNIDARDVKCMRDEISKLAVLDISAVTINEYSGYGGTESGSNYYSENEMPQYSFGNFEKGKTTLTSIKLPTTLTGIGSYSFMNCTGLISIILPINVRIINDSAFAGCTGLTTINIPANASSLDEGESIFSGCSNLTSITVDAANKNHSSLGGVWFDKLQTVLIKYPEGKKGSYTIPTTVKTIASGAFTNCIDLTGSLTIPASLTTLSSFYGCIGLTAFIADAANPAYSSKDGVLFNKEQTEIILFPAGKTGRYVVPSTVTSFNEVTDLSGLSALTIPSTISGDLYLATDLNESYTNYKFKYLETPSRLFNSASLDGLYQKFTIDTIKINSGNIIDIHFEVIKSFTTSVNFLDLSQTTNTTLPKSALLDLNEMEELILPAGLTTLSYRSVAECVSLKSIQIPASVTEIGMRAFENCRSMASVNFSTNSQLKIIDNWAFYACHGLKDIVIPSGVTSVGDGAFWGCEYLTNLSLPSTVQKINDSGFDGCIALNNIRVDAAIPPTVSAKTFNRVNRNATLYVPDASITQYKNAFGWKEFYNIKGISTQLEEVDTPSYGIRVSNNTIEITNAAGQNIEVFDISGRMLFTKSNVTDYQEVSIPQKGVYLLKIGAFKKKVMVN